MQTLPVRAATSIDLPRLASLWYENTVLQQQADPRIQMAIDGESRWSSAASTWLTDDSTALLVAESAGRVVGYIAGQVQPGKPGLLPEHRGVVLEMAIDAHGYQAGVGRELFAALRAWFVERGIRELTVHVTRRHAVEQAFWRALGAKEWMDCLWMKC